MSGCGHEESRRSWLAGIPAAGLTVAVMLLLAACGGGSSSKPAATDTTGGGGAGSPQASGSAATSATQAAKPAGELRILGVQPTTLDPAAVSLAADSAYVVEIFGGLVTQDRSLQVKPDLAESWDVSADRLVYTFHLRKGAQFHSGRAVTAADVKYSIDRAATPASGFVPASLYLADIVGVDEKLSGKATAVSGVVAVDDQTVRITLKSPVASFLSKLTYPCSFVVDRQQVEQDPKGWTTHPNGTGPFKVVETAGRLELEANEKYHLGAPGVAKVTFQFVSQDAALFMWAKDELDVLAYLSLDGISKAGVPPKTIPALSTAYLVVNTNVPPFDDLKVRQAFALTTDRQALAKLGGGAPTERVLPPGMPGADLPVKTLGSDAAKAKQLLAESKYAGKLPPIALASIQGQSGGVPALIAGWTRDLGVTVTSQTITQRGLAQGTFQLADSGWLADYADPENFLEPNFLGASTSNVGRYKNAEVDRLLAQARTETDTAKRKTLYNQVEQAVLDDVAWIPLMNPQDSAVLKPWVKGYDPAPIPLPFLRFVRIER